MRRITQGVVVKTLGTDFGSSNNEALFPLIKDESRRMVSLLEDPQPGLRTWNSCMLSVLQQLQSYSAGVLGTNRPVKFMELDAVSVSLSSLGTRGPLSIERILDVTGLCPLRNWDVYFIYVREEGRSGVIIRDGGSSLVYWLDQLDAEVVSTDRDNTFKKIAWLFGLSPEGLRAIIEKYKP